MLTGIQYHFAATLMGKRPGGTRCRCDCGPKGQTSALKSLLGVCNQGVLAAEEMSNGRDIHQKTIGRIDRGPWSPPECPGSQALEQGEIARFVVRFCCNYRA